MFFKLYGRFMVDNTDQEVPSSIVPARVNRVVSSIPRPMNDTGILHIQLTRRLRYRHNYADGNVRVDLVKSSARILCQQPVYRMFNIGFNDHGLIQQRTETDDNDSNDNDGGDLDLGQQGMGIDNVDNNDNNGDDSDNHGLDEQPMEIDDNNDDGNDGGDDDYLDIAGGLEEMLLVTQDHGIRMAPVEGETPLAVTTDPYSDFLAFPKIFGGHYLSEMEDNTLFFFFELCYRFKSNTLQLSNSVEQLSELRLLALTQHLPFRSN
ncbi:uncharacterized protein BX664DRAFT_164734 [Halteromyces radiatus]|uniref:uncharacterized protein n=1 Tax=Halteromyces radiatus TaxID=101107 RepID=UPI0022201596|nr:uncharacterized protein BX664DRAFT_164734 [Halteromyces radiatus]KAI8086762.1 hypothetical protein BX664DRAFT_164734 [Halteromyces radiatus]